MLYTAKGTAALVVPFASVLAAATGSWTVVLALAGAANVVAAVMAVAVLRPLRLREVRRNVAEASAAFTTSVGAEVAASATSPAASAAVV
jgi:OFA family oxalate/formate antiporter-like MFS transporter